MKSLPTLMLVALLASSGTAAALKYSDRQKVDKAMEAIAMADALEAGTPENINCRIGLASTGGPGAGGPGRQVQPEVVLVTGQQAFDNLLAAMTTKINNDRDTAEAYLTSVGVTTD